MRYTVTGEGTRHFEVINEMNAPVGTRDYQTWRPNRARMTTFDGLVYDIAPVGFWQMSMAVTRDDVPYAELKRTPAVGIKVRLATSAMYTFRRKSLWQGSYSLENEAQEELATIFSTFNWRKFSFDYDIETFAPTVDQQTAQLLPMLLVYCMRSLNVQRSGLF